MSSQPSPHGRILVVDDEAAIARLACVGLERAGFATASACDGVTALEMLEAAGPFDLVLLDMTMPGTSGIDVFHTMRRRQDGPPVVITSGYTRQEAEAHYDLRGIAGFVQKPFRPADLARSLLTLLERAAVAAGDAREHRS